MKGSVYLSLLSDNFCFQLTEINSQRQFILRKSYFIIVISNAKQHIQANRINLQSETGLKQYHLSSIHNSIISEYEENN